MGGTYTHFGPRRHRLGDGWLQCDLCPRYCKLRDGQRGLCFVRARKGDGVVLTTYGRSSGFCIDPIEKKPLNYFLPGTPVLSFGTAGYITADAREEFFRDMDAANIDLEAVPIVYSSALSSLEFFGRAG